MVNGTVEPMDFQAISIYQGITSEEIIKQTAKVIRKRKHLLSLFPDEYLDDKRHFEARINCLVRVVAHYVEHKNISLTVTAKELFGHPNKLPEISVLPWPTSAQTSFT